MKAFLLKKPAPIENYPLRLEESLIPVDGKYCGGNLTFYGLMDNETFGKFGLPLVGEPGMLITFPPNLGHEVTEVTSGERFTIATWYI